MIRLSAYSLKTGIIIILLIVLLSGMLLLDFVMIRVAEKDILNAEARRGRMILDIIEGNMRGLHNSAGTFYSRSSRRFQDLLGFLEKKQGLSAIVVDSKGEILFRGKTGPEKTKKLLEMARATLEKGSEIKSISGLSWGIVPFREGSLFLASPIIHDHIVLGAASVRIPLSIIYSSIRDSQKLALFYVFLNTVVLAAIGFYLIHRSVIRPINRLAGRVEQFREGEEIYLLSGAEQNEFVRLSRALNTMVRRVEDNKLELKETIDSLKKTNFQLRKAQEEVVRSEKLASVGRLASGVAHEIGNPIGIVLGYLGMLRDPELGEDERSDFISRIEKEIERINRTVRNLLAFSRPSKEEKRPISIHAILGDVMDMISSQPDMSEISVNQDFEAVRDVVQGDPDKVKQVFLNIAMNAVDAMGFDDRDSGGKEKLLSIGTELAEDEQMIRIYFKDSGPGIDPIEINKIFDPFYTTKEPGMGTGLGLSVSLRIAQDMGGDIKAASEKDKGTTLNVYFPLVEDS